MSRPTYKQCYIHLTQILKRPSNVDSIIINDSPARFVGLPDLHLIIGRIGSASIKKSSRIEQVEQVLDLGVVAHSDELDGQQREQAYVVAISEVVNVVKHLQQFCHVKE